MQLPSRRGVFQCDVLAVSPPEIEIWAVNTQTVSCLRTRRSASWAGLSNLAHYYTAVWIAHSVVGRQRTSLTTGGWCQMMLPECALRSVATSVLSSDWQPGWLVYAGWRNWLPPERAEMLLFIIRIRNQKWFNKDATDVHQPITVIQNEMTLLYSKK